MFKFLKKYPWLPLATVLAFGLFMLSMAAVRIGAPNNRIQHVKAYAGDPCQDQEIPKFSAQIWIQASGKSPIYVPVPGNTLTVCSYAVNVNAGAIQIFGGSKTTTDCDTFQNFLTGPLKRDQSLVGSMPVYGQNELCAYTTGSTVDIDGAVTFATTP